MRPGLWPTGFEVPGAEWATVWGSDEWQRSAEFHRRDLDKRLVLIPLADEVTIVSRSDDRTDGGVGDGTTTGGTGEWFARSTVRIALAVFGVVLLLFALGQAAGVDLLGAVADALSTQVGRWLAVAVFALLLIAVAVRGFGAWSSRGSTGDRERDR